MIASEQKDSSDFPGNHLSKYINNYFFFNSFIY